MPAIVKGSANPVLVRSFPNWNAETKTYTYEIEYQGTETAIRGLEANAKAGGLSYRISHDGPVFSIYITQPVVEIDENLDRWEISTESTEKSLFELPAIVTAAEGYDAALVDGEKTFKQECEDAVNTKAALIEAEPNAYEVIRHLRAGVTGWQVDLVTLRRTRKIELGTAFNYGISLDTGLLIYSTAQLNVPNDVAFALPATPSDISDLFTWGWRKRSQRVEIVGQFVEQTVELLFAPWSTLAYTNSGSNLAW